MRIGIVSDIHCNAPGLERALALMGSVDELVCVGDAIYEHSFSNEVIELLRRAGARMVLGNHEGVFLSPSGARARDVPGIDRDHLAWLGRQPETLQTQLNGRSILFVHGSPWSPHGEYVFPSTRNLSRFADLEVDYVVMGHTHYQMAQRAGRVALVNPGSTGEPRDPGNGRRLSFAVLDSSADEVRFCNFPDPSRPDMATGPDSDQTTWSVADLSAPAGAAAGLDTPWAR